MTNGRLKPPVSSFFGSFFIALLITNYSYYDGDYDDGGAAGDDKWGLRHPMNGLQRRDNDHDNASMENEERGTNENFVLSFVLGCHLKRGPNDASGP
jgi:hypothetical protein